MTMVESERELVLGLSTELRQATIYEQDEAHLAMIFV
jgi:hypothetical protein